MSSQEIFIKNPNNDFAMIQNYVIQLVSEKKINSSAFLLYAFYQSLNGFSEIKMGYRYIKENTGLSMGTITKSNSLLIQYNLIKCKNSGNGKVFKIELLANSSIPRRELKSPFSSEDEDINDCSPDEQGVHAMNGNSEKRSPDEHIHIVQSDILNTNNTTTGDNKNPKKTKELNQKNSTKKKEILYTNDEIVFIDKFVKSWMVHSNSKYYTKSDFEVVKELPDIEDATKYIEVLWYLDDIDKWVKNSDHSLSIFVKEYKNSKLQSVYPNTIYSTKVMPA